MYKKLLNILAIRLLIATITLATLLTACNDGDSFTTSPSALLTLETDTVTFDTIFSNVPTSYRMFWGRNNNNDGLRINNVRLLSGNQTGFRINVNGTALSQSQGYQANDFELRAGDSLRVFIELTAPYNNDEENKIKQLSDNLIFTLENGKQQQVNLKAYSWDATLLRAYNIQKDTTLSTTNNRPIVIYDTLKVAPGTTLTIAPGTTLYMHPEAVLKVSGTLRALGEKNNEITFRSDRLDNLFDYLPYDNTPGRWQGIILDSLSTNNTIQYTDIHGATDAITINKSRLLITHSTIHNNMGTGIASTASRLILQNTQVSNCLNDCLTLRADSISINQCTIAQYYPFSSTHGNAVNYTILPQTSVSRLAVSPSQGQNDETPQLLHISNTIITGYSEDELQLQLPTGSTLDQLNANIHHSILRTPENEALSQLGSILGEGNIYETPDDTLNAGENKFVTFDTTNFIYNFTPLTTSKAISAADPATSTDTDDRKGNPRHQTPDIGCLEHQE